ncbi:MAG TPA: CPBP family intramembrane glutamic endopeptidase [Ktedonobacteraceae bacterium]|nr:CPBP family intramembrane glutamic endopeptidase [Ktedonobacteraceae bacterium]
MTTLQSSQVVRSTVATSWRWMRPDFLTRIVPMTIGVFLYIAIFRPPLSSLGLTAGNISQQVLIGLLVGIMMAAFAATYRMYIVGPWFRHPTSYDHLFQACYYLCINGPVEELFFRGFLLGAITQWTGWLGWGWLVSTAAYTLYHRLGKWSWRSVGGVGLAGIVFSLVYLLQPDPRSLIAVSIVHGLTTCGFLSWGDELLYQRWKRRQARKQ